MNTLRTAVIGCGHLGRIHARLLSQLSQHQLIAVIDPRREAREPLAEELGCQALADYAPIVDHIDAAIVAAPTSLHTQIGLDLISQGVHLLMEKPLAASAPDAQRLNALAEQKQVVLSVGHVEQFNPAFEAAARSLHQPRWIEAVRTGGFTFRSTDVGVVLDLMIHDLDLVLTLVASPLTDVAATGQALLTDHEDFAEARLTFANGCVAQLKASRVSRTAQRQMMIHEVGRQTHIDFGEREVLRIDRSEQVRAATWQIDRLAPDEIQAFREDVFSTLLPTATVPVAEKNPLAAEQQDFLEAIVRQRAPRVTGRHAEGTLAVADRILACIHASSVRSDRKAA